MGYYHNKLDKKYFNKSFYVRKFEEVFNVRIKDYPLQYELLYETYNTLIVVNNILFSSNYIPVSQKVDNLIHTMRCYLNKYKNKISKCYDSNCIAIYNNLEITLDELLEMKELYETKGTKINLKSIEKFFEEYLVTLDMVDFDSLLDSKEMSYSKFANDKLPKKINCKILYDIDKKSNNSFNVDKQSSYNKSFIEQYYKTTGIDLNEDIEQKEYIFKILNRVKDINNAIVDYYIYKDNCVLHITNMLLAGDLKKDISCLKDITFTNLYNKMTDISKDIANNNIDTAYKKLKEIIEQFKNIYERAS